MRHPSLFSTFFAEDPPTVGFSILHRSPEYPKDTGKNIHQRGEFVVNLVSDDNLDQMNISAIDLGPHVDEFADAFKTVNGFEHTYMWAAKGNTENDPDAVDRSCRSPLFLPKGAL
jgi:hypothetical protein